MAVAYSCSIVLLVANMLTLRGGCHEIRNVVDSHDVSNDGDAIKENEDVFYYANNLSRSRRAVRQVKFVEIAENQRTITASLGSDYLERFAFKDPAPRHLNINPMTGAIVVRDGHKLDFETEPEFNFTIIVSAVGDGKRKFTTLCF